MASLRELFDDSKTNSLRKWNWPNALFWPEWVPFASTSLEFSVEYQDHKTSVASRCALNVENLDILLVLFDPQIQPMLGRFVIYPLAACVLSLRAFRELFCLGVSRKLAGCRARGFNPYPIQKLSDNLLCSNSVGTCQLLKADVLNSFSKHSRTACVEFLTLSFQRSLKLPLKFRAFVSGLLQLRLKLSIPFTKKCRILAALLFG